MESERLASASCMLQWLPLSDPGLLLRTELDGLVSPKGDDAAVLARANPEPER